MEFVLHTGGNLFHLQKLSGGLKPGSALLLFILQFTFLSLCPCVYAEVIRYAFE